jgi:Stress responsive A/B Barrel Domain
MIAHTVFFTLKYAKGSAAEAAFLAEADVLPRIPGVQNFQKLRQTSRKCDFDYGFSMQFADQAAFDAYNIHPLHTAFVNDRWIPEVVRFQEIDYVTL